MDLTAQKGLCVWGGTCDSRELTDELTLQTGANRVPRRGMSL